MLIAEDAVFTRYGVPQLEVASPTPTQEVFHVGPIALRLQSTDCLAILGANGSGKSTLLAGLAGAITASRGTVAWGAHRPFWWPSGGGSQASGIHDHLTVREQLVSWHRLTQPLDNSGTAALSAGEGLSPEKTGSAEKTGKTGSIEKIGGMGIAENTRNSGESLGQLAPAVCNQYQAFLDRWRACGTWNAAALIDLVALGGEWKCGKLSSGQRQRVMLAQMIIAPHCVWLLDEPETALDSAGIDLLCHVVRDRLRRASADPAIAGGIVWATHRAELVPSTAQWHLEGVA